MAIVDFIVSHYIVVFIIAVIIIFALIGRYVDKIGYLKQAPKKVEPIKPIKELNEEPLVEIKPIETPKVEVTEESKPELIISPDEENVATVNTNINIDDIDSALFAPIEGNNTYDELNKEVEELLPKKDVIDDDLLSDINNLSLDKTQKYNFGDIPDLDDVILPKIKKSDESEDIWKF